jgi:hypothetical protein
MEWKSWLRNVTRGIGIAVFAVGLTCMPGPLANPKAVTSLFPPLAAADMLIRIGIFTMVFGVLLFGISFFIPSDIRS